ncbi:beta-ketothiolase BktB [Brevundimonas sp. VNH65]|uniref:beta-ketothiolase BktB n=1 Tax=Brevundimonas sp. VNH65 TaxID=3400917 RepID=UPI003C0CE422
MSASVHIVAARRTAIGGFGGALKDCTPAELATHVTRAALEAGRIDPATVGHVVFGQVIPTCPRDAYLARVAAIEAGLPQATPAMTVNRLCGSGLQAVVSAAQMVMLGEAETAVAGGAEVMSRAPYFAPSVRWGQKMGDAALIDGLNGALTDPFGGGLMGVTAENVAERHGVDRQRQDAYAVESHRRAAAAIAEGRFTSQIAPIEVKSGRVARTFDTDEHVRPEAAMADLAKLRTIFRENGTVTAGNASGVNDGAAALVLAGEAAVARQGLASMARIVAWGHAGVDPNYMGMGPVPATRIALARAGLKVEDIDVIESNEAFAAQACAVSDALGLDPARTNPNGSGISLGHPVGATGAIILTKLVYELARVGGRFGLATMCIGGGQGIAVVIERS